MPNSYPETYFPVLVQIVIAAAVAGALVFLSTFLGKRVRVRAKDMPYESGMRPIGSARERFSVKYYLVAIVFILFDIEAISLTPAALVYREPKFFAFLEFLLFFLLFRAGFFNIRKKGALNG